MKSFFYRIFCGFFLGISVFAPGVSGSVIAILLGIYPWLLDILSDPLKKIKKEIFKLIPMGIGAAISLVLFVLVLGWLFETYPKATYLLFMGLIAGNLPVIFKDANEFGFKKRYIIPAVAAFAVALTLSLIQGSLPESHGMAYSGNLVYAGVAGITAGATSLIPGKSISMILIIFGMYEPLMMMAKNLLTHGPFSLSDGLTLGVVITGFIAAMIASSRLIKFLLKRFYSYTYFAIFGLICGSLVGIFFIMPKEDPNFNWLIGVLSLLAGLGISLLFVWLSKKFKVVETETIEQQPEETE